jgi:hypothetical protein
VGLALWIQGCGTQGSTEDASDATAPPDKDGSSVGDSASPRIDGGGGSLPDSGAPRIDGGAGSDSSALSPDSGGSADAGAGDAHAATDGPATDGPTADGSSPVPDSGSTGADPSVYQHHKNGTRDGVYTDLVLDKGTVATMHVLPGFLGTVSMSVYAQPLYVEKGPGGNEAFIIATETNHVTAFNATTGAILWDQGPTTYGASVSTGLPCGSVSPLGILGTPFIDPASPINGGQGVIYFDAINNVTGGTAKHMVYAVKLADGTVLPNWPVDVGATVPDFTANYQNQRGALQFLDGVLYVPYGGLNGDCIDAAHPYYGWVIGFPVNDPQHPTSWHTMAPKGGIWGPGSLPTDGTSLFPVTGNTEAAGNTWGGGEAVIRLGAGPTFSGSTMDYYTPTNWKALDNSDSDLGGASEVIFDLPGTSKPHLVAAGGKDSHVYLLNRDDLGGVGAELYNESMATNQFKGAPAVYTTATATYLAMRVEGGTNAACPGGRKGNLVVMKVTGGTSNPTLSVAWCSVETDLASPMVTTTNGTANAVVWDADNKLVGYDGDTGMEIVTGAMTTMTTAIEAWNTPIAPGKGRIAIGVKGQLYVFTAP